MKDFNEYCLEVIKDELPSMDGSSVYGCDLGHAITEEMNVNGTTTFSRAAAMDYIREWWTEAGNYWEYEKDNFGEHFHNPFDDPEAYMVCMIIEGVSSILAQSEYIDGKWNEDIELNAENIALILEQVENCNVQF